MGENGLKELIGIVTIIVVVSIASLILQTYLEKTSDEMVGKLEELKKEIREAVKNQNNEKAVSISNDILQKWEEVNEIWSMVIIHEELDTIKLSMLEVNAAVEAGSFDDGLEEIDKTIFLVEHVKEKEALMLKNIF